MKTLCDLHQTASLQAHLSLTKQTSFEVAEFKLEAFKIDEHDPKDWDSWSAEFDTCRKNFLIKRSQPAPSDSEGGKIISISGIITPAPHTLA